uniref:Uncharacterized protein n=1 Tax=Romanomermis culicivorax TaxID=13658 RepID=A0A915KV99_ROMCU
MPDSYEHSFIDAKNDDDVVPVRPSNVVLPCCTVVINNPASFIDVVNTVWDKDTEEDQTAYQTTDIIKLVINNELRVVKGNIDGIVLTTIVVTTAVGVSPIPEDIDRFDLGVIELGIPVAIDNFNQITSLEKDLHFAYMSIVKPNIGKVYLRLV